MSQFLTVTSLIKTEFNQALLGFMSRTGRDCGPGKEAGEVCGSLTALLHGH